MFRKNRKIDTDASDGGLIYADSDTGERGKNRDPADWRRLAVVVMAVIAVMTAVTISHTLWFSVQRREQRYNTARQLLDGREYAAAMVEFEALGDYRDSQTYLARLRDQRDAYDAAARLADQKRYEEAIAAFEALGDYADSREQAQFHVTYRMAADLAAETDIGERTLLSRLLDARTAMPEDPYITAMLGYDTAAEIFRQLGDYADAAEQADRCVYSAGLVALDCGNWTQALGYMEQMAPDTAAEFYVRYEAEYAQAGPGN